jgi:epidermal growth factor receptor substrate 15
MLRFQIWDLSDPDGKGTLDRNGFYVACKLVALVQDHQDLMVCNLKNESPAPNFGDATAPGAPTAKPVAKPSPSINFLVKPEEKRKYDALFMQLQPVNGKIPGDKVRQVMMGSKLPMPTLGKIWDLSDVDRDGLLDCYEFTVAMHLVYRNLQGDSIPDLLPTELSKEKVPQSLSSTASVNGSMPKVNLF